MSYFFILTSEGLFVFGPLGINFSELLIKIQTFSFTKMHLKMSCAKWRPSCPVRDELNNSHWFRWKEIIKIKSCYIMYRNRDTNTKNYNTAFWAVVVQKTVEMMNNLKLKLGVRENVVYWSWLELLCQNTNSNKTALEWASWVSCCKYAVVDYKIFVSRRTIRNMRNLYILISVMIEGDLLRKE